VTPDWKSRYDLAIEAAVAAGDYAKTIYDSTFDVEIKGDHSPVTIADRNAEAMIRERVARHFPNDGFLGEEYGDQPGTSGFRWIIDPVDGTKSFVRRIPMWGTLVGLEYRGEAIGGVVYMPTNRDIWHALRGNGCYHGERRVRVSDVAKLSDAFLCYSSIAWFERAGKQRAFLELSAKTARQRGYGDFHGYCLIAQGSVEIMIDHGVHAWDIAACKAIVEEAGGRMTDWQGGTSIDAPDVLATNGPLHDEVRAFLASRMA
jgi:histidinol-phosphatase